MTPMYRNLLIVTIINTLVMYFVTYVMVDQTSHIVTNINRAYMVGLMVAPMLVLMMLFMWSMFNNKKLNYSILFIALVSFGILFSFARNQSFVGNRQFLRSMIPHHSSAILMCEEASISDPEISILCEQIIQSQKEEIAQMENILKRY